MAKLISSCQTSVIRPVRPGVSPINSALGDKLYDAVSGLHELTTNTCRFWWNQSCWMGNSVTTCVTSPSVSFHQVFDLPLDPLSHFVLLIHEYERNTALLKGRRIVAIARDTVNNLEKCVGKQPACKDAFIQVFVYVELSFSAVSSTITILTHVTCPPCHVSSSSHNVLHHYALVDGSGRHGSLPS